MSQEGRFVTDSVDDQALAWVARLRSSDCNDTDRQAFALWLAQDTEHLIAMDSALELWDDLAAVRHLPMEHMVRPAANTSRWWAAAALAASLALAAVLWPGLVSEDAGQLLQTAYSEQRELQLEDGSSLNLNANSRVMLHFDKHERRLELLRGEAFFQVAKDPDRPFHVDTGHARVTAIGTAFNIRRQDGNATITVTEGVVRVTELVSAGTVAGSEVLHANQQLLASAGGLQQAASVDPTGALAWQRGELVAEALPLPVLLAELKRYHDIDILVTDPEVAAMTVSGLFRMDQPEAILEALQLSHNLQLSDLDDSGARLLSPRQ